MSNGVPGGGTGSPLCHRMRQCYIRVLCLSGLQIQIACLTNQCENRRRRTNKCEANIKRVTLYLAEDKGVSDHLVDYESLWHQGGRPSDAAHSSGVAQ